MDSPRSSEPAIGLFDSGVGGLSVLRALRLRLPHANLHYVADSAYAPYGDRSGEEVIERSRRLAQHLLRAGASMIVIACNTATMAAIRALRAQWPEVPFVGVEPGIKPAVARSPTGRIGVLATRGTVASERLRSLVAQHASQAQVLLQPCAGLADAIEAGDLEADPIDRLLERYCAPLKEARVDTVVLGCTHYAFVAPRIQAIMGLQVQLVDTADAVAQRAQSLWSSTNVGTSGHGALRLETTGDPSLLSNVANRWLRCFETAERVQA